MLDPVPGQAVYTPTILAVYDTAVLRISQPLAWRCPSSRILSLYSSMMSEDHLDVGVGTGYFLRRVPVSRLTLFDMNPNSLRMAGRRLRSYSPTLVQGNVLSLADLPAGPFGSIGLNCLLHCLPGSFADKGVVFANLRAVMRPGAWLFGSTVPGASPDQNVLGRAILRSYNRRGIWSNLSDTVSGLREALGQHFSTFEVEMVGRSALFRARCD